MILLNHLFTVGPLVLLTCGNMSVLRAEYGAQVLPQRGATVLRPYTHDKAALGGESLSWCGRTVYWFFHTCWIGPNLLCTLLLWCWFTIKPVKMIKSIWDVLLTITNIHILKKVYRQVLLRNMNKHFRLGNIIY